MVLKLMESDLKRWLAEGLSSQLQLPVDKGVVEYLVAMDTKAEVEDYLERLLGKRSHQDFIREFLLRWTAVVEERRHHGNMEMIVAHSRQEKEELVLFEPKKTTKKSKKDVKEAPKATAPPPGFGIRPPQTSSAHKRSETGKKEGGVSKTKFVPLLSAEGESQLSIRFPGRFLCQCLGQKHELVNNCLECGRIVCSQEGPGPCLFCGSVVFTKQEEKLLQPDSHRGERTKEKILRQYGLKEVNVDSISGGKEEGLPAATRHRDKLLEFDSTSVRRTKVIDDESDYFRSDSRWISEKERKELKEKEDKYHQQKHDRKSKKITIDFAGRRIIEDEPIINDEKMEEDADAITSGSPSKRRDVYEDSHSFLCNPMVPVSPPKYLGNKRRKGGGGGKERDSIVPLPRLQDPNLMEMTDKGVCLSMHQPWASLLVCGIKRHEGRSWYTSHRGKLWIASTAKEPDPADIKNLESFYKDYYKDSGDITFPSTYPSGCLLGCVEVSDCLNREEYSDKYPNGESESQFVFICHSPQELLIKQPIKGKHKLWRLPRDVHNAAKRTLNYNS